MILVSTIFNPYNAAQLVDFILSTLLVIGMACLVIYFVKNKFVVICEIILTIVFILAQIFMMTETIYASLGVVLIFSIFALFVNMAETRKFFANKNNKIAPLAKKNPEVEKIFDHDSLYNTINEAVLYLSKNKIGALISFEKKDDLKSFIKNGSVLNSPVTFELLITIFYPGTRLHDGAVVIKGNMIIAASVYYAPTTKPLNGKYGSRHRAAIGISEVSDAVTVVVSEETGRISIAYNGGMESYSAENFLSAFVNIMNSTELESE